MGDPNKREPKRKAAAIMAATRLAAAAHQAAQALPTPAPPSVPECTAAGCPVNNRHVAKVYDENDATTPYIIKEYGARLKDCTARGERINHWDIKFLNKWYAAHNTARLIPKASRARFVKCTNDACPVRASHADKIYVEGAKDLPRIVKERVKRISVAWARGEDTSDTYDDWSLCQFFHVHGKKTDGVPGASSPSAGATSASA